MFLYPKVCLNTNCKNIFTKDSHLGWLPCNYYAIYCVVMCEKCRSKFKIKQYLDDSHTYYRSMPDENSGTGTNDITTEDIIEVKKMLKQNNMLKELSDGMIPGLSQTTKPKDNGKF